MKTIMEVLFGSDRLQKAKILMLLKERGMYVSQIARELGIDQPTVTSHLQSLESAGLVESEKYGPLKVYKLTQYAEREILPCLQKLLETLKSMN